MNIGPFDDADDPAAEPVREEVTLTADPPTRTEQAGPEKFNTGPSRAEYDPVLTIGERLAAITECTRTIDTLYRRIEEHAAAISVKATVMRGEL